MKFYGGGLRVFQAQVVPATKGTPLFILLMLLLLPTLSMGQSETRFKRFAQDQGLSMNDIRAITQDSKGFIWVGTLDGLNKFDGYQFQVYKNNPQDTSSLSNNTIWALLEDSEGDLYIGTDNGGLNIYDQEKDVLPLLNMILKMKLV